jgi:tRNA threonylcarbamoyladenosine biosynthesis protein TsaE
MKLTLKTSSSLETIELGKKIAEFVKPGLVITLTGDLGAGKTTLVGGLALELGINEKVTSPTFNILKCYFHKPISLYHIDAYRLEDGNKDIGLEEFIEGDGVCVIEWPHFIEEMIPEEVLNIEIRNIGDDNRELCFESDISYLSPLFNELGGR